MNEELYNQIKEKYGKDASWAIWNDPNADYEDPFTLLDYQKVKDKIKPNVVLVGFNPADNLFDDFSNFHNLKNDRRNLHPMTKANANKLKYAFINTEYEGAYMTDIIKLDAIKGRVEELAKSDKVKEYLKKYPEIVVESVRMFKEELDFIGSKDPLIIAMGGDTYDILKKYLREYSICKITHYAVYGDREKYKELVWKEIEDFKNGGQKEIFAGAVNGSCEEIDVDLTELTKKTLTRYSNVYPSDTAVLLKNIKTGHRKRMPFGNLPREEEDINNFLNDGWVMDYTDSDLIGLKRFRKIAKDKDIYLGYKIDELYIHLYLDGQSLGCWKRTKRYEPTTIIYNGTKYNTKEPKVFWDSPVLDGLIDAVISKRSRWR